MARNARPEWMEAVASTDAWRSSSPEGDLILRALAWAGQGVFLLEVGVRSVCACDEREIKLLRPCAVCD